MKDSLLDISNSRLFQALLKKAGVNPPPVLSRSKSPWGEQLLRDRNILIGGEGEHLGPLSKTFVKAGANIFTAPGLNDSTVSAMPHTALSSFENSEKMNTMKGIFYDASGMDSYAQLKELYGFFHQALLNLKGNARVVILTSIPQDQSHVLKQTLSQAVIGFAKSMAKELGPKGSTVQIIQSPEGKEGLDRSSPIAQFFLSDFSAFITGQVICTSTLAKAPENYNFAGSLAGKVVLVTGAIGGIGQGTVMAMAAEGAHVLCLDHESNKEKLEALAKEVDGTAIPLSLGQDDNPTKLAKIIKDSFGHVDILVHNAGITRDKTLKRMSEKLWDQVISVNLKSIVEITEHLAETGLLRDNGRVICLSSISGLAGNFGQSNYSSAKAGLIAFVNGFSKTVADKGITANCVAPGFIETPMTAKIPFMTRQFGRRLATLSQGGLPIDIANAITFLSSSAGQGVNGTVLRVCGGHLMGA